MIDQAETLRTGVREQQAFLRIAARRLVMTPGMGGGWRSNLLAWTCRMLGVIDDPLIIEPLRPDRQAVSAMARAGLQFAAGLVEQMVEETTGGDALPLLAYMLRELYQQAGADGVVTIAEYHGLGGVIGALQSRATGSETNSTAEDTVSR